MGFTTSPSLISSFLKAKFTLMLDRERVVYFDVLLVAKKKKLIFLIVTWLKGACCVLSFPTPLPVQHLNTLR